MKKQYGDCTVGDENVAITITCDSDLSDHSVQLELTKPSGGTIIREASVTSNTIQYLTVADDIDEDGEWCVDAYDITSKQYLLATGTFWVKPKPGEEART